MFSCSVHNLKAVIFIIHLRSCCLHEKIFAWKIGQDIDRTFFERTKSIGEEPKLQMYGLKKMSPHE